MRHSFTYEDSTVSYQKFGRGDRVLIGIHGFADKSSAFNALIDTLSPYFTVYCIDLPFHGDTTWNYDEFDRYDIAGIIRHILIASGKNDFSLMGHSMGGRIIFSILGIFKKRIENIYLFAPAGLESNLKLGRDLIPRPFRRWSKRYFMKKEKLPAWFYTLKNLNLIPRYAAGLVEAHFSTPYRRERLLNVWISMFNFPVLPKRSKRQLTAYKTNFYLYMGLNDKAIPFEQGERFVEGLPDVNLRLLPERHFIMTENLARVLGEDLSEQFAGK